MTDKPTPAPRTDADCWPFPCRDYHATWAHTEGEDPCNCGCHPTTTLSPFVRRALAAELPAKETYR